jgi:hypothetical protein
MRWITGAVIGILLLIFVGVALYWSGEPDRFDVLARAQESAELNGEQVVVGYTTTNTLIEIANTLLEKSGGFISNDLMPPGAMLDNITNWEFGVLVQVRDLSRALRKDFSRSQSQSREDPDLAIAEPQFNFDNDSWMFPASESEYKTGLDALRRYQHRLADVASGDAQFYARADNLRNWFADIETRLGSLSQRLSASVEAKRLNTDLAGDSQASQSTPVDDEVMVKTPWTEIDDVFYEARGTSWALIHLLRAVEKDFSSTLQKKNALVSLRQIIRELEGTQTSLGSPMIMNGSGFGLFANHSLVMASYIARANAGIINLRELLAQG